MSDESSHVQKMLSELGGLMRGMGLAVLCVLVILHLELLNSVPQAERIYLNVLKSRERLPDLTSLVIHFYGPQGGLQTLSFIVIAAMVAGYLMMRKSPGIWEMRVIAAILLVLTVAWLVADYGIKLPLMTIMEKISEEVFRQ